jgi:hypothetical protein
MTARSSTRTRSRFALSRRTVVRGMVGGSAVALGLPILEAMLDNHGEALAGGGALPTRLVTWFYGNGVALNDPNNGDSGLRFWPSTQGPAWELTPQLMPLANVRDYVSLLSGFDVGAAAAHRRGHHDGCAMFAGWPFIELPPGNANYASKMGGPTVDQVAANAIGGETYLPSIELAVSKRIVTGEGPTLQYLAHKGPDEPLSQIFHPLEAWDRLFGSFTVPDDPTKPHRLAALDAVSEDVARLKARVGAADKLRLDAHLDSIAEVRGQIDALAPVCEIPPAPGQTNDDVNGQEPLLAVNEAMNELIRLAFVCDVTRVVSLQFTGSVGYTVFDMVGTNVGHHDLTHDGTQNETVDQTTIVTMGALANLLEKLMNQTEGAGNLLDSSCVFVGSDASSGLTHSVFDMPIIVAGGGGGRLKHPGVFYRSQSGEDTSDILLACLQTVVPDATEVGGDTGYSNTPCAALLA